MKHLLFAGAALVATPVFAQEAQDPHAGHDMSQMQGMDHSMHQQATPDAPADDMPMDHSAHMGHTMPSVPDSEVGNAPPPPVPTDHPADAFWDSQRMAQARADLAKEGRFFGNALILDRFEYRPRNGKDGFAWQAMGWVGATLTGLRSKPKVMARSALRWKRVKCARPGVTRSTRGGTLNSVCDRTSRRGRIGPMA